MELTFPVRVLHLAGTGRKRGTSPAAMSAVRVPAFLAGAVLGVLLARQLGICEAAAAGMWWCWEWDAVVTAGGVGINAAELAALVLGGGPRAG